MELIFAPTKPQPWKPTSEKLAELIDTSYRALKDAEPPRKYLGASMMGGECARAVAYGYHNVPRDADRGFDGRLYRIFDMGHDGETRMAQYLRIAGFDLIEKNRHGKQFEYTQANGKMKGHIDGVIIAGPDIGCPWPALWENKALNNDGFNKAMDDGIEKSKPLYFAQAQIYMAYMELDRCLFTCQNKDTCEIFCEIIDLDVAKAQKISDRGVQIVLSQSPTEFPRITKDETDYRCRFCDWHDTCWKPARIEQQQRPAPSWLTKGD
jgi:hypothetical protein